MWWTLSAMAATWNIPQDFVSIEAAVLSNQLLDGDTLHLDAGVHAGFDFTTGTNVQSLTIVGEGTNSTLIVAAPTGGAPALRFSGFVIMISALGIDGAGVASGVVATDSDLEFIDVRIFGGVSTELNQAGMTIGGGLLLSGGTATLEQVTITRNVADTGAGIALIEQASLMIDGSIVSENTASMSGGGLFTAFNPVPIQITDTQFIRNTASSGAAISTGTNLTVADSLFDTNAAAINGGAINSESSPDITIVRSIFVDNIAGRGGALAGKATWAVQTTNFMGNTASLGGAIHQADSTIALDNSSFCSNDAQSGSAILTTSSGTASLRNVLFMHHTGGSTIQGPGAIDFQYGTFHGNTGPWNLEVDGPLTMNAVAFEQFGVQASNPLMVSGNAFQSADQVGGTVSLSDQLLFPIEINDTAGCEPYIGFPYPGASALIDVYPASVDVDGTPADVGHLGGPDLNVAFFGADRDGDNFLVHIDCDDADPLISPNASEICDGIDNDCNGRIDEAGEQVFVDEDLDGWGAGPPFAGCPQHGLVLQGFDCDDTDSGIHPMADEICDGIDNDCDTITDEAGDQVYVDADDDGYGAGIATAGCPASGWSIDGTDCDDNDPSANPGAPEQCDNIDHNCNGPADDGVVQLEWFADTDDDGFGAGSPVLDCAPVGGHSLTPGDCDDNDPLINPNADEVCDTIDNNCNGQTDDDDSVVGTPRWYIDTDEDAFGDDLIWVEQCAPPTGYVNEAGDCDDSNPDIFIGAPEACVDTLDNDCDGLIDSDDPDFSFAGVEYGFDADSDGYGNPASTTVACSGAQPPGYVSMTRGEDCDDAVPTTHPDAPEICNAIDDDCHGGPDDGLLFLDYFTDSDADGFGDPLTAPVNACEQPANTAGNALDCDDADPLRNPLTIEICNQIDDDCDQIVDNHLPTVAYYPDADADGYGDSGAHPVDSCEPVAGLIPENTDCNDIDASIHPGAADVPDDGIDSDCDGSQEHVPVPVVDTDGDGIPDDIDGDPLRSSTDQTVAPPAPAFGCGCQASAPSSIWAGLLAAGLLATRRRRGT